MRMVCVCVIILTWVIVCVCADPAPCREVNGCNPKVLWGSDVSFLPSIEQILHELTLHAYFVMSNFYFFFFFWSFWSPPQGLHEELILILRFPFPQTPSTDSPPPFPPTPPPSPAPCLLLTPTLQLLFWISQIAPVRSSDPSPLPPTELQSILDCSLCVSCTCAEAALVELAGVCQGVCMSRACSLPRLHRAAKTFLLFKPRKAHRCWHTAHTS